MTLDKDATYFPACHAEVEVNTVVAAEEDKIEDVSPGQDPFYASTLPVIYALAATTLTAYILVIMLFITPRTFISGGTVVLGARGFSNGSSGAEAGVGIGGRPWLQKVAALGVAISLSIATATTFQIAEEQYYSGYMDAKALQVSVLGGKEIKIIMTVSDAFLWLAQAQTLIRLFPRHREKIIIKWTALALISLCTLFNILNKFLYKASTRPNTFVEAVPALSYLFQLALGLLYCAWVMYYAVTKKRYAFYHPRMRNMCLLAIISIVSILIPTVFFVVDISKPSVAGWGDYVRWVGACAASVVVWEWVERIEALEREDKRDGVLGREVFDGDEMLEVTPATIVTEKSSRGGSSGSSVAGSGKWPTNSNGVRPRSKHHNGRKKRRKRAEEGLQRRRISQVVDLPIPMPQLPVRPPAVATPVSRTDTASAESTIYAVRYHPIGEGEEAQPQRTSSRASSLASRRSRQNFDVEAQLESSDISSLESRKPSTATSTTPSSTHPQPQPAAPTAISRLWNSLPTLNPFTRIRQRQRPPPEVANFVRRMSFHNRDAANRVANRDANRDASRDANRDANRDIERGESEKEGWDIMGKIEDFASGKVEQVRGRLRRGGEDVLPTLPVTRIPAPPPPPLGRMGGGLQ